MVLCPCCGVATAGPDDGMCESCAMEDAMATERMDALVNDGHHPHCASRMVYGDGECECEKKGIIPGPISRIMWEGWR